MGMKPKVKRVCVVCKAKLNAAHNRKTCGDECAHKRRMAKQNKRRGSWFSQGIAGTEWAS